MPALLCIIPSIGDNAFGLLGVLLYVVQSLVCGDRPAGAECIGESLAWGLLVTAWVAFNRSRFACPAGTSDITGGPGCTA